MFLTLSCRFVYVVFKLIAIEQQKMATSLVISIEYTEKWGFTGDISICLWFKPGPRHHEFMDCIEKWVNAAGVELPEALALARVFIIPMSIQSKVKFQYQACINFGAT
jgi:hypothetical protein